MLAVLALCPAVTQAQMSRLAPPDTSRANHFGSSIGLDGSLAVIGAPGSAVCGENSGAAYLYSRQSDGTWTLLQALAPSECQPGHFFGKRVAISDSVAVVVSYRPFFSAATSNTVHVFRPGPDGYWRPVQHIRQPDGDGSGVFGTSLALDAGRLVVSTSGDTSTGAYSGVVHVYEEDATGDFRLAHTVRPRVPPSVAISGSEVALDGDHMAIAGSSYAGDRPGIVSLYERSATGTWEESGVIRGVDAFFPSIDLHGDRLAIGENRGGPNGSGRVRILQRRPDSTWYVQSTVLPRTPFPHGAFGTLVQLGEQRLVAVGYDEQLELDVNIDRIAYVFTETQERDWTQSQVIDVGRSSFATAVEMEGRIIFLGQTSDDLPGQVWVAQIR
ncbi:MAG: hypothetical protein RIE53_08250 [Rhodothermales bacterium]